MEDLETMIKIAAGLMVLGVSFTVIDFCLAKLLQKMYPDSNYWTKELGSPVLSSERQRSLQQRQRLYQNGISHRFRKWRIILFLFGSLLLAIGSILHVLR